MAQEALRRVPELTTKHILRQTGNSIRRLTKLLERLKEFRDINSDRDVGELIPAAANGLVALPR